MSKKSLILLVILSLCTISEFAHSRVLSIAEAINKSGQQRMLSQRIAKNYLLIKHRINAADARVELDESIALFEQNMLDLGDTVATPECIKKYKNLENEWAQFRKFVLAKVKQDKSEQILQRNTKLLGVAHELVLALEKLSSVSTAKLVNISGRQRMLSQRIALYYSASAIGISDPTIGQNFDIAVTEFEQGLKTLMAARVNTPEIKSKLEKVYRQWTFYRDKLSGLGEQPYVPRVIRVITEGFLKDMDALTRQYEVLLSDTSEIS